MATASHTGDTLWTTVDTAAASNFVGSAKYLLFVVGKMVTDDAANPSGEWRVAQGATPTVMDRSFHKLETAAVSTDASQYNWFTVFTQPATAVDIVFQHRTTDSAKTVTTEDMYIFWMRLDEGLIEDTDWKFVTNTSGPTTHTTAMVSRTSVTWTPATAGHDWLVLGSASVLINSDTVNYEIDLYDSTGTTVLALHSREGEDAAEEQQQTLIGALTSLPASSQTVQVRTRDDATGSNSYDKAAVFVMDLNLFKDHFVSTAGSLSQVDTNFLQANTATVTPQVAGDWWFLAGARYLTANAWGVGRQRLQLDAATVPSGFDSNSRYPRFYDATGQQFAMVAASEWLDVSSHTIDHDVRWMNGTGQTWNDRTLVGWSMELATSQVADSGALTSEAATVIAEPATTDTATVTETSSVAADTTATDTATLAETSSVDTEVTVTDAGTLSESATLVTINEKTATDDASLSGESASRTIVTASMPTIVIECAFGADPFDASPTWTAITAYITEKSTCQRGQQHELARIEAGTANFVLYSDDDRFNPENTAGPYYPNLKPLVQIRVRATDPLTSTDYTIWRGYIQGWPQTWTLNGKQSRVPIRCVDALGLFARIPITDWDTAVNADSPIAFWRFGTGSTLTDETANSNDGTVNGSPSDAVSSGIVGVLGYDTDGSADRYKSFDGVNDNVDTFTDEVALDLTSDLTFETWVSIPSSEADTQLRVISRRLVSDIPYRLAVRIFTAGNSDIVLFWNDWDGSNNFATTAVTSLVSGVMTFDTFHHIVVTRDMTLGIVETYVDGVHKGASTVTSTPPSVTGNYTMIAAENEGPTTYDKIDISELVVYDKVLSAGRIAAHYNARSMFGGGETVNNNVAALIPLVGWPTALHSVLGSSTSDAAIPSVAIDESFLSLIRRITESQETPIFVDRDGNLTEMTRDYRAKSKNTPDFTIGDGAAEYGYVGLNVPNDSTLIRNLWRVTPVSGQAEEVSDATSDSSFETRDKQITNALIAENQSPVDTTGSQTLALARAQSGLAKTKDAIFRIEKVTINPLAHADYWQHVLPVDFTDRIKLNRTPPGGSLQTHEAYVEHVKHEFTVRQTWLTTLRLSPASLQDQWILGDSVMSLLGETSRLGW